MCTKKTRNIYSLQSLSKTLCSFVLCVIFLDQGRGFKFSILHNNDLHARYDPMKGSSEKCPKGDDEKGLCFGGFARVSTVVEKARAAGQTLYLNAGDTFQGTPWYTFYKGEMAAEMMNMLNPDAMSLGNHEFDDNVDGLLPFLNLVKFPIVCCNLDLGKVPSMQNIESLSKSIVIRKLEKAIGIIGYLTPETKNLVTANDVEYFDEIDCINSEAKKLVEQGVNIIIALGHSGYSRDQEIAKKCPEVDLVIGGHSHTFLYTGAPPAKDMPEGNYPTIVINSDGRKVPVLQAYAYSKYLGEIHLEFDNGGNLINFRGKPMLLDSSVPLDSSIKAVLDARRTKIDELDEQIVGISKVFLNGSSCRKVECNFGNLITDAMVYGRIAEDQGGLYFTDAAIAFANGGGIRASIDPGLEGIVTGADVPTVLPFGNTLSVTRIKGMNIIKLLEHSASVRNTSLAGGFLQVSGLRITLNYNRPKGKRVTSVQVLCADCPSPHFEPLDKHKYYGVIVNTFILNGGDGHKYFKDPNSYISVMQMIDRENLAKYFQEHKVVYPMLEGRIKIVEKHRKSCASSLRSVLNIFIALKILLTH
ncbi:protein 5NUC-like [Drosophila sulfurigaster albostrigata]|uniref:protein 5NUC-like n=1 Tax=Drosophila sulfurigaster albostrigata TaxID=89887 RepID=UPI002D21CC1C|nr:protein 5NUC-like [Drosophila sulfurigaster albostrigata]XP_062131827.1 protein 5NUC-like [Drosophila sulfurigaster albostrigata]